MRTIEEIKNDLERSEAFDPDVQNLFKNELIKAQDLEIARLLDAIMEIRNAANECSRSCVVEALSCIEDVCKEMLKPK